MRPHLHPQDVGAHPNANAGITFQRGGNPRAKLRIGGGNDQTRGLSGNNLQTIATIFTGQSVLCKQNADTVPPWQMMAQRETHTDGRDQRLRRQFHS